MPELVYRVGGEEFLVLLPGCDLERTSAVAERVRAAVETAQPGGLSVTASVGLRAEAGDGIEFDELFRAAERGPLRGQARRSQPGRVAARGRCGLSARASVETGKAATATAIRLARR